MATEQTSEAETMETPFQAYDYVLYVGRTRSWQGLYLVRRNNPDGTVVVRAVNGGEISRCPAADLKLLFRPTPEQFQQAGLSKE